MTFRLSLFFGASVAVVIVVTERVPVSPTQEIVFYSYDSDPLVPSNQVSSTADYCVNFRWFYFPVTSVEPDLLLDVISSEDQRRCDFSDGATTGEAYEIREPLHVGD